MVKQNKYCILFSESLKNSKKNKSFLNNKKLLSGGEENKSSWPFLSHF